MPATWWAYRGAASAAATMSANTTSAATAVRWRRRRRSVARHGPVAGTGRPPSTASAGIEGLGSKAGSVVGSNATGRSCSDPRTQRRAPPLSRGLFQAEASPIVGGDRPVVALAVREVHAGGEEGALLARAVHAPVGLILGMPVQRRPLPFGLRRQLLGGEGVDLLGVRSVRGVDGQVLVVDRAHVVGVEQRVDEV